MTTTAAITASIASIEDLYKVLYGVRPHFLQLQTMNLQDLEELYSSLEREYEVEQEWLNLQLDREQAAWEAANEADEAAQAARKAAEALRAEESILDGWYHIQDALAGF